MRLLVEPEIARAHCPEVARALLSQDAVLLFLAEQLLGPSRNVRLALLAVDLVRVAVDESDESPLVARKHDSAVVERVDLDVVALLKLDRQLSSTVTQGRISDGVEPAGVVIFDEVAEAAAFGSLDAVVTELLEHGLETVYAAVVVRLDELQEVGP